jgi:prepilin-type N-terminal cleavage/methylation domain-containing protein/prepilin-type processing-associated H-X9-DG protein
MNARHSINGPTGSRRGAFTLIELLVVIAIIAILAAILFPVFAKARDRAKASACVSNLKQISNAMRLYADDNDDRFGRKWWEWHVDLEPYIKSGEIFICPSSQAKRPVRKTFTNYLFSNGETRSGEFWTNHPTSLGIWGHYTRNDELIWNFGYRWNEFKGNTSAQQGWKSSTDIILLAEAKDGKEDNDADNYNDDNAPYIEPGATTWSEVYDLLSARHSGGQNCVFADGHASFRRKEWFRIAEGRFAISPPKAALNDTQAW